MRLLKMTLCAFALALAGCPQAIEPFDGGVDDGGNTDGGTRGGDGEDGGTGGGTGGETGGGTGTDLTWGRLFPQSSTAYGAISGRVTPVYEVFVGDGHGRIHRFADNAWAPVYQTADNLEISAIWVDPDGKVFAAGGAFITCTSATCLQSTSFTTQSKNVGITAICGTTQANLYAAGNGVGGVTGVLWKWNAGTGLWVEVASNTDTTTNTGCHVTANGDVYIAAQSKLVRYSGASLTVEQVNYPGTFTTSDIANQFFNAVTGDGTNLYAAGSRRRIVQRQSNGTWSFVFEPAGVGEFNAIVAPSPDAAHTGGARQTNATMAKKTGPASFAYDTTAPDISIFAMWAPSPNEVWIGGIVPNSVTGSIYRGTK